MKQNLNLFLLTIFVLFGVERGRAQVKYTIGSMWLESQAPFSDKWHKIDTSLTDKWFKLFKYRQNYKIWGALNKNIPPTKRCIIPSINNDIYESVILCNWVCEDTCLAFYDKRINKFAIIHKNYQSQIANSEIYSFDILDIYIYDSLGRVEIIYSEKLVGFRKIIFYNHTERGSFESSTINVIHTCVDYDMSFLLSQPYFFMPPIHSKDIDIPYFVTFMSQYRDKYSYDEECSTETLYTKAQICE